MRKMKNITFALLMAVLINSIAFGQVGIGTPNPDSSSILELKTINKGFLGPRVALSSNTDQTTIPSPATGLLVYNLGTSGLTFKGYVYWDGSEWRQINNGSTSNPLIGSQSCGAATLTPATFTAGVPYNGTLLIPYSGGNGGSYNAGTPITSSGVTGLTATLQPGTLSYGSGNLIYSVTGTPSASTPNIATFAIPSQFGGAGCSVKVGGQSLPATVDTNSVMDNFKLTNEDGVVGYQVSATSPDGKFSVRAFIVSHDFDANAGSFGNPDTYQAINLQIRNNTGQNVAIAHQSNFQWFGAVGGSGNNMLGLVPGKWSGDNNSQFLNQTTVVYGGYLDGTAAAGSTCATPSASTTNRCRFTWWGDPSVYAAGVPEYRRYTWSINDQGGPITKTHYMLTFSSASSAPNSFADVANCPNGICNSTKAFLRIEQITAQ